MNISKKPKPILLLVPVLNAPKLVIAAYITVYYVLRCVHGHMAKVTHFNYHSYKYSKRVQPINYAHVQKGVNKTGQTQSVQLSRRGVPTIGYPLIPTSL